MMMFGSRIVAICLALLLGCVAAPTAHAQTPESAPLVLAAQPALAAQVDAFPRLATADFAAARINAALAAADQRGGAAASDCQKNAAAQGLPATPPAFTRTVTVAMRGPTFLALDASDNLFCGGAHPDTAIFALAYDLNTGRPLDWLRLFPATMVATAVLDTADDGTPVGEVTAPALTALFIQALDKDGATDCAAALQDSPVAFILWPDAKDDGIDLYDGNMPFATSACAGPETIGLPDLRKLGVSPGLLDAIAAAHDQGWYGPN
jgi:hypothetical protein